METSCGSTDLYITLEPAIEYKAFAYLTVSNIHVVALSSIVSVSHVRNYRCNESNRHVPLTHADYPIQRLRCTHHLDHIRIPHYVLACSRGAIWPNAVRVQNINDCIVPSCERIYDRRVAHRLTNVQVSSFSAKYSNSDIMRIGSTTRYNLWLPKSNSCHATKKPTSTVFYQVYGVGTSECAYMLIWCGHGNMCYYNNLTHAWAQAFIEVFLFAIQRFIFCNKEASWLLR